MLNVLTPDEALRLMESAFQPLRKVVLREHGAAHGDVLAEDVAASEYVPDFDRSTVDGYAVLAKDTFGCSDAIPAILPVIGAVQMGQTPDFKLAPGTCAAIPTGGALPEGADCAVMVEYTEDYGDGTIGVMKSAAPGQNLIFRGDDVKPGDLLFSKGRRLTASDVGALAALGKTKLLVEAPLTVGVISTGDELVAPEQTPGPGQVRDVNTPMLLALLQEWGVEAVDFGRVPDVEAELLERVSQAAERCDLVLISGGSSVGQKDAVCRVLETVGEVLMHGIAIKPGKPTILARTRDGKPLVGLPGHPAAAYYIARLFVRPLVDRLCGEHHPEKTVTAKLTESVNANHGRAQITACRLEKKDHEFYAAPIRSKSGLITQLARADGFFVIPRDCEGLPQGAAVEVIIHH